MKLPGAPMLFAAPLPPIWIPRTRALILGRAPECDLILTSRQASRRHAAVRYEGETVVMEDLSSTNGSRVNGVEVEGVRPLSPGDRIEIGGSIIIFCQVESQFETTDAGEKTVSVGDHETPPDPEVFRGDLTEIPIPVVLQILEASRKSGVVRILRPGEGAARVWVECGEPVHAETDIGEGFDAACEVFGLDRGRFVFEVGARPPRYTLTGSMTTLLLEASRVQDEGCRTISR